MSLQINIASGQRVDGSIAGLGWLTPAGNPWTVPDGLAVDAVGKGLATPVNWPTLPIYPNIPGVVGNAPQFTFGGAAVSLSEVSPVQSLTVTATAFSGANYFRGIVVRAISGTPQTVTVYDATSATGTPIATFTVSALGTYFWDGDQVTPGSGKGARRPGATGCHVVISGGTSRTIDVMVEGA